jgi:hypothetical protein
MDLVERYLAAIARELPKAQAKDVTAELRDTLLSEIEEREAGLGRPLERQELEALLKDFGHPLVVAGRYRKVQHLIGPQVYPFWVATLRVVLAIEAALWLGGLVISFATAKAPVAGIAQNVTSSLLTVAVFSVGVVTLIFAAVERAGASQLYRGWSPGSLPPVRTLRRGRFEIASAIVANVIFLLWWAGLIHFRGLVPIPTFLEVRLAPVWSELYWPIVAYNVFEIGMHGCELVNPGAVRTNAALSLIRCLAGAAILAYAFQAGHWVQVEAPSLRPDVLARIQAGFDAGMRLGLMGTAVFLAIRSGIDAWRLIRGAPASPQLGRA